MPHIRFRGMEKQEIKDISIDITRKLAAVIECPEDWFTLEYISTDFIFGGEDSKGYPFVEVLWFDRGQEVKDRAAKIITEAVRKSRRKDDICVIFTNLDGKNYYENGTHF